MKKVLTSAFVINLLVTFLPLTTFSQVEEELKKGYIGLSIGASMPVGKFGSIKGDEEGSGFAKTGLAVSLDVCYRLNKSIGLTGMVRTRFNAVDVIELEKGFEKSIPGTKWNVEADPYFDASLLGGLYVSLPFDDNAITIFEARIMAGYMNATSGYSKITGTDGFLTIWQEVDMATTSGLTFLIGTGLRVNLSPSMSLLVNLDYQGAKMEFTANGRVSDGQQFREKYNQQMGSVNANIGLGIRL